MKIKLQHRIAFSITIIILTIITFIIYFIYVELEKNTNEVIINHLLIVFGIFSIIGIISACLVSVSIKRTIFGLEPSEIAIMMSQRDLVLKSINNGIVAINNKGELMLYNKLAEDVFGFKNGDIGRNVDLFNIKYLNKMNNVLKNKCSMFNVEVEVNPTTIIVGSFTIINNYDNEILGVLSTFIDMSKVKMLAEKFAGVKQLNDNLRAQNHEFINKLHIISGLIQLEEYDVALNYISEVAKEREGITHILSNNIKDLKVSALLLGKYNQATEAKIDFVIDPNSSLKLLHTRITSDNLCSIIGNLINNAIDELVELEDRKLYIKIIDDKNGIEIIIKDNGCGIDDKIKHKIFNKGVTTKNGEKRGYGLWIVKNIVSECGGKIKLDSKDGTIWDITIPD